MMPFSTINDISVSVKKFNLILVFFKAACNVNPGAEKNEQDQAHIF